MFLFAHQQLVFRYPLHNPFEVMPVGDAASLPPSGGTDAASQAVGGQSSGSVPGAAAGSEGGTLAQSVASNASTLPGSIGGGNSSVPTASSSTSPKVPSCVGVEVSTVMFLLRNAYSRLTTLRIGVCSFLVWPLHGVKGEAALVVALGQADDSYSHVARFVQVFVNVLLREEARCGYVTTSIDAMLAAIEAAGTSRATSSSVPPAADISAPLQVAPGGRKGAGGSRAPNEVPPLLSTGVGELDAMHRAAHAAQGGLFVELRLVTETINGQYHQDVVVNQLLIIPHSHMSGHVRHRRQVVASFSSRFHSGSVVTIADAYFADTRRQQYEHVVGRDVAELLPLDDIERLLLQLPSPRTLYGLRSGLERRLTERLQMNAREGRSGGGSAGAVHSSNSSRYTPPLPTASGSGGDDVSCSDSGANATVQDAPFIVFEVIEFLRLFGAITLHTQRLTMTRGRLATPAAAMKISPIATPQQRRGVAAAVGAMPVTPGGRSGAQQHQGGSPLGSIGPCVLGPTCIECELQQSAIVPDTTSPLSDIGGAAGYPTNHSMTSSTGHNAATHSSSEVQHQLLYRHYHSEYDDPWFVASEVEHRQQESLLQVAHNKNPSLRVYERKYEASAQHRVSASLVSESAAPPRLLSALHSPNSHSLGATLSSSTDFAEGQRVSHANASGFGQAPQDGSQWKEQVTGLQRPSDVPLAASAWLLRHSDELRRRVVLWLRTSAVQQPSGTPMLQLDERRRHRRTDSQLSAHEDSGVVGIDSQGSLTRRRCFELPMKSTSGGAAPSSSTNDHAYLPDEVLLRLVLHLVVIFLWQSGDEYTGGLGLHTPPTTADKFMHKRGGTQREKNDDGDTASTSNSAKLFPSLDDLAAKVEWTLRHVAPTLRNMNYAMLRQDAVSSYEAHRRSRLSSASRSAEVDGDAAAALLSSTTGPPAPHPLTVAETKILTMTSAMESLHLLNDMKPFAGREIRRIPCRRLVHTAVNLLPDVVSVVLVPSKLPAAAAI